MVLQEAEIEDKGRYASVDLATLDRRICEQYGVPAGSLGGGGGSWDVSKARSILCYVAHPSQVGQRDFSGCFLGYQLDLQLLVEKRGESNADKSTDWGAWLCRDESCETPA